MKKALKRTYGETIGKQKEATIKTEPVYHTCGAEGGKFQEGHHTQTEETFYAEKWKKFRNKNNTIGRTNDMSNNLQKVLKYPIPKGRNPSDKFGYQTHCNIAIL